MMESAMDNAPDISHLGAPSACAVDVQNHLLTRVMVARQAMKNRAQFMWEGAGLPAPMDARQIGSHEWQPFWDNYVLARDVPIPEDKRQDLSIIQFKITQPFMMPLHRHNVRVVHFCNSGSMELVVEGVRIQLTPGHLFDVEPGQMQMWIIERGCQITSTFIPGLPWKDE